MLQPVLQVSPRIVGVIDGVYTVRRKLVMGSFSQEGVPIGDTIEAVFVKCAEHESNGTFTTYSHETFIVEKWPVKYLYRTAEFQDNLGA